MSDEKNPKFIFNGLDRSLLIKIATGKIDAQEIAREEAKNRGINKRGQWVGFKKAEKIWEEK